MQPQQLKTLVVDTLEQHKAGDIMTMDVSGSTTITDYMVICSGESVQHNQVLAKYLIQFAKNNYIKSRGVEGEKNGTWILVDLHDVIIHIMTPETREFYSLEKLWHVTEETRFEKG
jgi:ribosome-associated protein